MVTISLCMIVKNEETTLERCLSSVAEVVDEIIIVDTGSDDRTKEIAAKFTGKVYDFEWIDDFSAARDFSHKHAAMDYILWLDADDIILPADAAKLKKLKQNLPPEYATVMMKYNTGFDNKGNVTFSYYRERLSKRSGGFKWREPVHEYLDVAGKRLTSDICVTHAKSHDNAGGRNMRIYENLIAKGKDLSPRGMYYYARELKDHERYADAIRWFNLFLDSGHGWVEDNISACGGLARCYQAQNMQNEALAALLRSFTYDTPRAETCCQLGYFYKDRNQYKHAAFWFELALTLDDADNLWGFKNDDCRGYIPCIELAVCYDKLGNLEKAMHFNDMAYEHKPDSPAVLYNKKYFEGKIL